MAVDASAAAVSPDALKRLTDRAATFSCTLAHCCLRVPNMRDELAFYRQLGMSVVERFHSTADADDDTESTPLVALVGFAAQGGARAALKLIYSRADRDADAELGFSHVVVGVTALDTTLATLDAAGARAGALLEAAAATPTGREAWWRTPGGHRVLLVERTTPRPLPHAALLHVAVRVTELDTAAAFYSLLFGLRRTDSVRRRPGAPTQRIATLVAPRNGFDGGVDELAGALQLVQCAPTQSERAQLPAANGFAHLSIALASLPAFVEHCDQLDLRTMAIDEQSVFVNDEDGYFVKVVDSTMQRSIKPLERQALAICAWTGDANDVLASIGDENERSQLARQLSAHAAVDNAAAAVAADAAAAKKPPVRPARSSSLTQLKSSRSSSLTNVAPPHANDDSSNAKSSSSSSSSSSAAASKPSSSASPPSASPPSTSPSSTSPRSRKEKKDKRKESKSAATSSSPPPPPPAETRSMSSDAMSTAPMKRVSPVVVTSDGDALLSGATTTTSSASASGVDHVRSPRRSNKASKLLGMTEEDVAQVATGNLLATTSNEALAGGGSLDAHRSGGTLRHNKGGGGSGGSGGSGGASAAGKTIEAPPGVDRQAAKLSDKLGIDVEQVRKERLNAIDEHSRSRVNQLYTDEEIKRRMAMPSKPQRMLTSTIISMTPNGEIQLATRQPGRFGVPSATAPTTAATTQAPSSSNLARPAPPDVPAHRTGGGPTLTASAGSTTTAKPDGGGRVHRVSRAKVPSATARSGAGAAAIHAPSFDFQRFQPNTGGLQRDRSVHFTGTLVAYQERKAGMDIQEI